jgi:hypothetical protein
MRYLNQHTDANFQVKHHRNVKHKALLDSPAGVLVPVKYAHVPVSQRQQQRNELAINKAEWASRGLRSTDQSPRQSIKHYVSLYICLSKINYLLIQDWFVICISPCSCHHLHLANVELGHFLTRSVLTGPEVPLMVSPGFFCLLACSFFNVLGNLL